MMKRLALMLAVATVAAACSSSADDPVVAETSDGADTSQTTTSVSTPQGDSTTDSIGDDGATLVPNQTIAPEGPAAPDFTMALANGDTFTLSEQATPVYMIFWADW
jgi:hypothetical protein